MPSAAIFSDLLAHFQPPQWTRAADFGYTVVSVQNVVAVRANQLDTRTVLERVKVRLLSPARWTTINRLMATHVF